MTPAEHHETANPPHGVTDTFVYDDDLMPDSTTAVTSHRMSEDASPKNDISYTPPTIPGFDDLQEIGRGGMGVVFKARDVIFNRFVAVKMLSPERPPTAEDLIRFRLEAELAARVRHENVVQVYESGSIGLRPYLVMEWIDGGSLAEWLKTTPTLPPETAARLVAIFARAVHHAHVNGVIHRDLKPGNILLSNGSGDRVNLGNREVTPKVTDFGLAKFAHADIGLTETGRIMGTPEYMAPEQAAGQNRDLGPACDIHALGVLLYQLLAGHTPFRGPSTFSVVKNVIEAEPVSLRVVPMTARVPFDLETVCMKCLRKRPGERYATAAALADDLDAVLTGRPITARPVSRLERAWKFARRNPAVCTLTSALAASILAGFAISMVQWQRTRQERNRAVLAEKEAVRQRDTSDAVNRFLLTDLISAAAPDRTQGRSVLLVDAVEDSALRVEGAFPNQPQVEAGVLAALGQSFRKLGRPAMAEAPLRKALRFRETELGETHPETLKTAHELALALDDLGRWPEADAMSNLALTQAIATLGEQHPVTLDLQAARGLMMHVHGRSDEAEAMLNVALATRTRISGVNHTDTLRILNDLGMIAYERKQHAKAAELIRRAFEGRMVTLGASHPDTLESLNNHGAILEATGDFPAAKSIFEDLKARTTRVRGPHHADTLSAVNNLGRLHARLRNQPQALACFQQAAKQAAESSSLGPQHPLTLRFRHNAATALVALSRRDEALRELGDIYRLRKAILPLDHSDTLQSGHDYGALLILAGTPCPAVDLLADVHRARKSRDGHAHENTVVTLITWCRAVQLSGSLDPMLARVLAEIHSTLTNLAIPATQKSQLTAAAQRLSARQNRFKHSARTQAVTAGDACDSALEMARNCFQENDAPAALGPSFDAVAIAMKLPESERFPRLTTAWSFAGQAALIVGDAKRAFDPLKSNHEYWKVNSPASYDLGLAANLLGRCQTALGNYQEAEHLLREAIDLLRTSPKLGLSKEDRAKRTDRAVDDLKALLEAIRSASHSR